MTLSEPGFVGTSKNVTVPEGREVVLSCTVKNFEGHKVKSLFDTFKSLQNYDNSRNILSLKITLGMS